MRTLSWLLQGCRSTEFSDQNPRPRGPRTPACMVPAGKERAPKRSPQSGPQALPCFWPRASFPRAESMGVSVSGKRVVRPSWRVCFPQDVPGPPCCREQRGAGEETAVRPSRPSAVRPALIERTRLCGDAEMPRGAWKREGSHAPGSGDPPTLLPKGHLERGPKCPQEEGVRGGSPTSSQGRVQRTWKRTSQDRELEQKEGPRIRSETGGSQPRGHRPSRRKGCEAPGVAPNMHPLSHGLRNRQAWCPLGASPLGPNASLGHSFRGPECQRARRAVARSPPAPPGKAPGGRAPAPCPPPPATLLVQTAELGAADRERASLHRPDLPNDQ